MDAGVAWKKQVRPSKLSYHHSLTKTINAHALKKIKKIAKDLMQQGLEEMQRSQRNIIAIAKPVKKEGDEVKQSEKEAM